MPIAGGVHKLTPNVCSCPFLSYSTFSLLFRRLVNFNGTVTLTRKTLVTFAIFWQNLRTSRGPSLPFFFIRS